MPPHDIVEPFSLLVHATRAHTWTDPDEHFDEMARHDAFLERHSWSFAWAKDGAQGTAWTAYSPEQLGWPVEMPDRTVRLSASAAQAFGAFCQALNGDAITFGGLLTGDEAQQARAILREARPKCTT